jgi:hypothetical protein
MFLTSDSDSAIRIGSAANPTSRSVSAKLDNKMYDGPCKVGVVKTANITRPLHRIVGIASRALMIAKLIK